MVDSKEQEEHVAMKPPPRGKSMTEQGPTPKDKTQIARRLTEAVNAAPVTNRSADLVPLGHEYNTLRNRLRSLTASLRTHQAAMEQLDKAHMDVAKEIADLSEKSPISIHVAGAMAGSAKKSPESYMGVHETLSKQTKSAMKKYQNTIVDYVEEWDRVLTTRVEEEQKETQRLNGVLNHYQTKVEGLRMVVNKQLDKGKQSPVRTTEKLSRNENKLKDAWEEHERAASRLCDLLQEATEHGWKDLYPLVVAMAKFDSEKSAEEQAILSKLDVVEALLLSTAEEEPTEKVPPPPVVDTSSEEEEEVEKESSEDSEGKAAAQSAKKDTAEKSEEVGSPTAVSEYEKEGAADDAPAMPKLEV